MSGYKPKQLKGNFKETYLVSDSALPVPMMEL